MAQYVVPDELGGERLDRVVAVLAEVSRSVARSVVLDGAVQVDGRVVSSASLRVGAGDQLTVVLPAPEPVVAPEPVAFEVAYEDESIVVVDKPAGLVVHPGAGNRSGTLANGLAHRYPELLEMGEAHRWGIVHRIDRTTTGLLLVARTPGAHRSLQQDLKARRITRRYAALVWGSFDAATGTIDAPLGRHPVHPTRIAVVSDGRFARTHYERKAQWDRPALTLLDVTLDTGRTHQIRVHMASIRHAVVGDRTYGRSGPVEVDPGRVWLHARSLDFPHPVTSRVLRVRSALPADLERSLTALGEPVWGGVPPEYREGGLI